MNLKIETTSGVIVGFEENGVRKFLGFPYAESPVGENRFRKTVPVRRREKEIQAKEFGPKCPQILIPIIPDNGICQDEDCLSMNIWAPAECEKAAVIFWVYGGALASGEGSDAVYDGTSMVKRGDVLLVTFNYRVGIFGGFYPLNRYEKLKESYIPNAGLYDVLEALKWVQENIAAFGGDPKNVTIAGESAGAVIVGALASMPQAEDLYAKVIMESYADISGFQQPGRDYTGEFMSQMGLNERNADKLLSASSDEILKAYDVMCSGMPTMSGANLVTEGVLLTAPVLEMLQECKGQKTVLIGTNKDEASVFIPPEMVGTPQGEAMKVNMTENIFEKPTYAFADKLAKKNDVYMYRFDYAPAVIRETLGAFHSAEMIYVFGNLNTSVNECEEEARKVSDTMLDSWIAFAKKGRPGWTTFTAENKTRLHFDLEIGEKTIS